jgi:transcriptional regulator with XRE-family HTH domain
VISVKEERLNRGLTLRELAEAAGVSVGAAQRADAGQTVRPDNAKALADYFDCKVTDIWPVDEGIPTGASSREVA